MEQLKAFFRNSGDRFGTPEIVEVGKGESFDLLWKSEPPLMQRWTWDDPGALRVEPGERFFLGCIFVGAANTDPTLSCKTATLFRGST